MYGFFFKPAEHYSYRSGPFVGSKTKGPGEEGAAGYCPKILLPKRGQNGALLFPLKISHFLRRNFWMISGGPFLSRPLCLIADFGKVSPICLDLWHFSPLYPYLRIVKSTPDSDAFEKYRDTPPISTARLLQNMLSSWPKVVYAPPSCITIQLPFASPCCCKSIGFRGRWNTPKLRWAKSRNSYRRVTSESYRCDSNR